LRCSSSSKGEVEAEGGEDVVDVAEEEVEEVGGEDRRARAEIMTQRTRRMETRMSMPTLDEMDLRVVVYGIKRELLISLNFRQKRMERREPKVRFPLNFFFRVILKNFMANQISPLLVYTVSEAERIRFTKILMGLREGEETRLEFPPDLTNTERKFIHQLASQLGLVSKSTGKGETRRIVVTKRADVKKSTGTDEFMPVLNIGKRGIDSLKRHMKKHPPTHEEELESRETGALLAETLQTKGGDVTATLDQLGIGVVKKAPMLKPREKYIDLERRKKSHADYQEQKKSNQDMYLKSIESRSRLPAFSRQEEIVALVAANPVTVIQGETGTFVIGKVLHSLFQRPLYVSCVLPVRVESF
jgi:hypothetical protein